MRAMRIMLAILGVLWLAACAGEPTTSSTPEETTGSEEGVRADDEMPEPPKVKADDPRYGY